MSTNSLLKKDLLASKIKPKHEINSLLESWISILIPKKVNNVVENSETTDMQKTVKKQTILNNRNSFSNSKTISARMSPVKRQLFEFTTKKIIQDIGLKNIINAENYLSYLIKHSKIPYYLRDYQALDALEIATRYVEGFE